LRAGGHRVAESALRDPDVRDEAGDVVPALHRERRQLEGGDPPLRAALQRCDVLRRQRQSHRLVQVRRGILGGEAQVVGTDLDELGARQQPRQRQRRIGAGRDHQVDLRGQVLEQEGHRLVHVARRDDVVVVEYQHHVVRDGIEVVDQGHEGLVHRRLGRLQERERAGTHPVLRPLQCGEKVGPEHDRVVVPLIEREPRRRPSPSSDGGQPLRQQRRLAEAGRGRHQRQGHLAPTVQTLAQSRARNQAAPPPRDVELGSEQRACHDRLSSARTPGRKEVARANRPYWFASTSRTSSGRCSRCSRCTTRPGPRRWCPDGRWTWEPGGGMQQRRGDREQDHGGGAERRHVRRGEQQAAADEADNGAAAEQAGFPVRLDERRRGPLIRGG
jgi:hypothetical protein